MKYTSETTIKDVVADDFRSAAVFQRHGLDFCCGGARPIGEACNAKGFDAAELLTELEAISQTPENGAPKFARWDLDMLADYIVANHHRYVREVLPAIAQHAEKVARVHGTYRPELLRVAALFGHVAADLTAHMGKEEQVLFPYIRSLALWKRDGSSVETPSFGTIQNPIRMLELEHIIAGDEMAELNTITGGYTPPMDACATYRVLFQELQAFEQDLHIHVHLENNILFPKAIDIEHEMKGELEVPPSVTLVEQQG